MKTQLYKYDGTPLFEVIVDDTSSQDWSLMSDNKLSVSFELEECVVLTAGCYIEFDGTRFYLLNEYKPTMVSRSAWKYDLTLGDAASWLSITLALKTIDGENTPLFKYTGPAAEHAAIIVANLNRRMDTDKWKVGSVISTENIAIDYSGKYCSEVLQEIVDAKDTEWWIDGMTLNIGRAEFGESVTLGYANGVLGDIVCDTAGDMRSYAYLFPIGSTRNIDPTKYGHDRLQLPSGLVSVPINPEQGIAELKEEAAFAHIYPRYEGTISAVRYARATNQDGTPFLIYYIKDTSIPFNPNEYEIAGLVKHITFQSGELMYQEFEVNYSADSNEFELRTRWTGDVQLPGGVLVPAVGDKYVVWNITMPDVYYTIASHELLDAARAYAADAIKDVSVYKVKLDYIEVQERGLKLRPGQRVRLMSDEYFASGYYDSRITRITRNIAYPDELSVDISAVRVVGTLSRLQASIQKTENVVAQFSGQLPAIIKSNDDTSADDSSVYTSAKSEKEFLNKRKGGKVSAPVTFDEVAEFLNGLVAQKYIKIGNGYLRYNDELGAWAMEGDLLVTGGFAWFASIKGFKPSTIMDAVQVDGESIVINELGQLKAIGGGSGGSGGGLTISDLSNYLTTNKYTKQSDVETLISTALTPYALTAAIPTNNNQLSNGAGYITASALKGYATENWVTNKGYITASALTGYATEQWVKDGGYLTGITSKMVTDALGYTPYNSSNPDKYIKGINYDMVIAALGYTPYSTTNPMGYLTITSLNGYATEQWVGENYLAKSGGMISGTEEGVLKINTSYTVGVAVNFRVGGKSRAWVGYNTSDGAYLGDSDWGYTLRIGTDGKPYYRSYELIHANNIGSYNAGSANILAATYSENIDYERGSNALKMIKCFSNDGSFASNYQSGISVITDYCGWQMTSYGSTNYPNPYFRHLTDNYGWSSWKQLAFLTDNVASATKLQTARSIWGQPFNGTDNIGYDGKSQWLFMNFNGEGIYITGDSISWHDSSNAWAKGLLGFIADGTVVAHNKLAVGRTTADYAIHIDGITKTRGFLSDSIAIETNSSGAMGSNGGEINRANGILYLQYDNSKNVSLCYGGGGVAVGGKTADAKLHVHGDILASNRLTIDTSVNAPIITKTTVSQNWMAVFEGYASSAASGRRININFGKSNTAYNMGWIGLYYAGDGSMSNKLCLGLHSFTDALTIAADGITTINGNLFVNGGLSWVSQSQESLKHIISEQGLSLAQLERIKPIKFYWKDGRDAVLHVGGVADVYAEVLPEVVSHWKNTLCLNYVDASFYTAASLIAPVVDHERRITEGERERKALKKENASLKRELAIMKQMLNQLAA